MKKQGLVLIILSIVMVFSLCGCSSNEKEEYFQNEEIAQGGIEDKEMGMNIKDIDIDFYQDQTEISLHIIYGSREEVQSEAIITKLPKYEVFLLDEPYRLAIRVYGIEYVDYIEKQSWVLGEHVVGVFRERISDKDYTTVYFQLAEDVKFKVLEGEGKIRVFLNSKNESKSKSHFVMLNAFDEYLEGLVDESYGLTPVMCTDKTNISLISKPFPTSEKAETYLKEIEGKIKNSPLTKKPYTMTLAGDILPVYNSEIDISLPENKKMVVEDSIAKTLPVIFENGRFVAESEDKIIFAKSYVEQEDDSSFFGEKLWMLYNVDKKEPFNLPAFSYIKDAAFSMDGRYLAFIDFNMDTKVLYVYDFEKDMLYNLGEEGFGIYTYSFTWASDEDSIYALTGNDDIQIAKCSFLETGIEIHAIIEEDEGEGKIADYGDKLIYADNFAGEFGIIYSIDKITGEKEMLTEGVDFKISPNQSNMAVIQQKDLSEESSVVDLKIYSMLDKSETIVASDTVIESYDFLPSSNTLLYSDGSVSDFTYRFNYGLQHYNTGTKELKSISYMSSGEFYLSKNKAVVYLLDYVLGFDGKFTFTTYEYDIDRLLNN